MDRKHTYVALELIALAVPALVSAAVMAQSGGLEEITVTARRREENLQTVPIAVSALSAEGLENRGVASISELQFATPSVTVGPGTFRKSTLNFSIRGYDSGGRQLTEDSTIGLYFAEAPITSPVGQNQGFFDIASVQVLKGPQGTLFGRNSTGGAVLIEPVRPKKEFGGYAKGGFGDYGAYTLEGVVNIPVNDRVAVRVGAVHTYHDGYNTNILSGQEFDDQDSYAWRVSAEIELTDRLKTYIVYDHMSHKESGNAMILNNVGFPVTQPNPDVVTVGRPACIATFAGDPRTYCIPATLTGFGQTYITNFQAALARQLPRGFETFESNAYPGSPNSRHQKLPYDDVHNIGITNHTEFEINENLRIKNVFGFRRTDYALFEDIDGSALNILQTENQFEADQYSEEFQVQGTSFNGKVDWIAGFFFFNNVGRDWTLRNQLLGGNYRANRAGANNTSYAAFVQGNWKVTDQLTFTAGVRYTKDDRYISIDNRAPDLQTCAFVGAPANCLVELSESWSDPSYNINFAYQFTDRLMAYVAHRRGYRTGAFAARATGFDEVGPWDKEIALDMEIGVKSEFEVGSMPVRFNADFYKVWWDNLQVTIPRTAQRGATILLVNTAETQGSINLHGVEIEANALPLENLSVDFTFAWNYAEWGDDFPNFQLRDARRQVVIDYGFAGNQAYGTGRSYTAPEFTFTAGFRYGLTMLPAAWGEISLGAHYYNRSHGWDNKGYFKTPAYGLLNINADWKKIAGSRFDAAFYMRNATDREYVVGDFSSNMDGLMFNSIIPGDPRTFGFTLTYNFGAE
ncbi:MAG: TonB-dependent receptor [Gammaproteobacteria bacterium]